MHRAEGEPIDAEIKSLQSELQAALQERNALWADAQRTRALEAELKHARAVIEDMKGSPSWRVTRPLRAVKTLPRRTYKRLRRAVRGW